MYRLLNPGHEDSCTHTKGDETKQVDNPKEMDHVAEEIAEIEYERDASLEGEAHKSDNNAGYLEIKEIMITKNSQTKDCIIAILCDSLGTQRNFKENMRSRKRRKRKKR